MTRDDLIRVISMLEGNAKSASSQARHGDQRGADYWNGRTDAVNIVIGHLSYYLKKEG